MSEFAKKLWKSERLNKLRELAGTMSVKDIAVEMGLDVEAVKNGASTYGISVAFEKKVWTEEMNQFVLTNAGKMARVDIAKHIGVTVDALSYRACYVFDISLRVKAKKKPKPKLKKRKKKCTP